MACELQCHPRRELMAHIEKSHATAQKQSWTDLNNVATDPVPWCRIDCKFNIFMLRGCCQLSTQAHTPLPAGIEALNDFAVQPNRISDVLA